MRIHDTKLPYGIENQSVLIRKRICNVCNVSIMLQNRIQEMIKIIEYIY